MFRQTDVTDDAAMSFANYKIDYNRCLGSGVFGTVYAVVDRPENEKGFFSYWMPYAYDYVFRADISPQESSPYCVKISKTAIRMVYENPTHPFRFKLPWHSFFEGAKEQKTNEVLRKNSISKICFFKSNSFYSQFKTRINGNTLHHYITGGIFLEPAQFAMRKSFVDFMQLIKNPKFTFWELHENNIMFDEKNKRWEIVDGIFNETDNTKLNKTSDNLTFFLAHLFQSNVTPKIEYWLKELSEAAKLEKEYTIQDDELIRERSVSCDIQAKLG